MIGSAADNIEQQSTPRRTIKGFICVLGSRLGVGSAKNRRQSSEVIEDIDVVERLRMFVTKELNEPKTATR